MFRRISVLVLATTCSLSGSGVVRAQTPPAPPFAPPGNYYLALGDSLAYGVTVPGIAPDPTCQSPTAPGYVCVVYGYLKQINAQIQLKNLADTDVDSCVMVYGFGAGSACVNSPGGGTLPSPLDAAVTFISSHQGQVGPVTVNVGGADLIPLLPQALTDPSGTAAKLPALLRAFTANLDVILSRLRAAVGASEEIILLTQYNPLGGIGSPPLSPGLPEIAAGAIGALNQIMKTEAAKYSGAVADVATAFDASPGGAALLTYVPTSLASGDPSKIDIYPQPQGYRLAADLALKAGGYSAPLELTVKLSHKSVRKGKSEKASGSGIASSNITIKLSPPHGKAKSVDLTADDNGAYSSEALAAGKHTGKGNVRVCTSDPVSGEQKCSTARYTVH